MKMTKQVINLDDGMYIAVMGRKGKAEKVIISDNPNLVFLETRVNDRISKILYEDEIFKTFGSDTNEDRS